MKNEADLIREAKEFQGKAKVKKIKWQKSRNKMKHLTPKKKKRK